MLNEYDCKYVIGIEADDAMCIDADDQSIICTRDKDLRIKPGWHFGWECGKQPQFGPKLIDEIGYLEEKKDGLAGGGYKFFYAQMLMGDVVDNIPGCLGVGKKKAFSTLAELTTEQEMYDAVKELYKQSYPDNWKDVIKEQANLLWIIRERDADGNPVMYKPPHLRG